MPVWGGGECRKASRERCQGKEGGRECFGTLLRSTTHLRLVRCSRCRSGFCFASSSAVLLDELSDFLCVVGGRRVKGR